MIGFNLTFFPMHFAGLFGMPRRVFTYPAALNVDSYNLLSTVGAFIFGFSSLIMVWNIFVSARRGAKASANPWDAPHLEWSIPSPPHHYNFPRIPIVKSREPLWDAAEKREIEAATMDERAPEPLMPNPSYWPMLLAASVTLAWGLVMTGTWWVIVLGILPVMFCVYMWAFEPAFPEGA
jgi:heme/copper-type cytochrome/quinol oxidase subunit 1